MHHQRQLDGGMGTAMAISVYQQHARHLISHDDWRLVNLKIQNNPQQALQQIKYALANHNRLVFAIVIDPYLEDKGKNIGAMATLKANNDSWVITKLLEKHLQSEIEIGGHAIIVTGYDDNACLAHEGKNICGFLTVRNSVGAQLGDNGDFYISYNYFNRLAHGSVFAIGPAYQ